MGTAADLAKASRNAPQMPAARAARYSHEARVEFWRVFAVTFFIGVVFCAILFVGAVAIFGNPRTQISREAATSNDSIARVRRPLLDGTLCRDMMIDNKTSRTIEDKVEPCSLVIDKPKAKSKPEFVWGGK